MQLPRKWGPESILLMILFPPWPTECTFDDMRNAEKHFLRLLKDSRGQGVVEYLLLLALVAFGCVASLPGVACRLTCALENVGNQLERLVLDADKKIPPGQAKKCSRKCD